MKAKRNIILIEPVEKPGIYSNLKLACQAKGWAYSTLSKKELPFEYKGYKISKREVNANE